MMVWNYAIISFLIASAEKAGTHRPLGHKIGGQARHLARAEHHVAS